MPIASSSFASAALADHELHLFHEIDGIALTGPTVTLGGVLGPENDCLPEDQRAALTGRYRDQKVWQETAEEVGSDLYEHLRGIISGQRMDLARVWTLAPQGARLLDTADLYEEGTPTDRRIAKYLAVNLGSRATARLRGHGIEPRPLALAIEKVTMHVFTTGKSLVHSVVRFRPADRATVESEARPAALELMEGQAALLRGGRLSWASGAETQSGKIATFNFGLLMHRLALGHPAAIRETARVMTYTYLRLADALAAPAVDRLAVHLARHYTTDYAIGDAIEGIQRIRAFENVLHAVSLEGAVSIIVPSDATGAVPEFLENFNLRTLRRHYIPIALLAHHEYCFLVDRTSRSVIKPDQNRDLNLTLKDLAELRLHSLVFRLCFRFSQVSHISMHNELNRAFRQALGLDQMLREFAADIAEIESFLRSVGEHRLRTQLYLFSIIGGASLAGLSALTIFRESAKVLLRYGWVKNSLHSLLAPAIEGGWISWPLHPDRIGLFFGLVVFLVAAWLIWRRRPIAHVEVEGDSPMHSLLEHMSSAPQRRMGPPDVSGRGPA